MIVYWHWYVFIHYELSIFRGWHTFLLQREQFLWPTILTAISYPWCPGRVCKLHTKVLQNSNWSWKTKMHDFWSLEKVHFTALHLFIAQVIYICAHTFANIMCTQNQEEIVQLACFISSMFKLRYCYLYSVWWVSPKLNYVYDVVWWAGGLYVHLK